MPRYHSLKSLQAQRQKAEALLEEKQRRVREAKVAERREQERLALVEEKRLGRIAMGCGLAGLPEDVLEKAFLGVVAEWQARGKEEHRC